MVGLKWTVDVLEGRKTVKQMAEFFGVTVNEAWEHVEQHVTADQLREWGRGDDQFVSKMQKMVQVLEDYVDLLAADLSPDVGRIKALTAVVRELRGTLMDYAELVGRIQRGQVIVQVQQIEQKVQQLTMVVLEEVCPECRERILKRLEEVGLDVR